MRKYFLEGRYGERGRYWLTLIVHNLPPCLSSDHFNETRTLRICLKVRFGPHTNERTRRFAGVYRETVLTRYLIPVQRNCLDETHGIYQPCIVVLRHIPTDITSAVQDAHVAWKTESHYLDTIFYFLFVLFLLTIYILTYSSPYIIFGKRLF